MRGARPSPDPNRGPAWEAVAASLRYRAGRALQEADEFALASTYAAPDETLAAYARRMGAQRPGWTFATGAPEQVQSLVERMQVMDSRRKSPRPEEHRTSLYLFDASGELVQRFAGAPLDRPRLAAEITRLARKSLPAPQ